MNDIIPSFSSLEEKCQYYKEEYEIYKSKFISLNTEYERLLENNKKLYENINKERKLRKELEDKSKYSNYTNSNNNININNNKKENNIQDEFVILENDFDSGEDELLNISCDNKNKSFDIINQISFSILPKNKLQKVLIEKEKQNNDVQKININHNNLNIKRDVKSNNQNKGDNKNNNKSNIKLITEEILNQDFIKYSKETISLLNSINENELKIDKIYYFIQKFSRYLKILKRGASFFNKSISLFIKNLSIYNTENKNVFEAWPFLTEFISLIQKSFTTINIYCSSLITTIESSSIIQINDIITKNFTNLSNIRNKLNIKREEFKSFRSEFLSNKNYEVMKNKYYKEYKEYELSKYDYFSSINKFLMLIKLKLPEIISLLIYSYYIYFTSVEKELKQINDTVRKNLESLLGSINLKNKIENDIIINRKKIIENIQIFDKAKKEKEGFLYVKEKDGYKFSKRYVKISKGHLIYYKIKKGIKPNFENLDNKIFIKIIDYVDFETPFDICQLLFSNVKKYGKNYYYPFCFEVNMANTKAGYIFQADTEYEMEEWISAITNAISGQISDFNGDQNDNGINKDINNNLFNNKKEEDVLLEIKNKNSIVALIQNNICADCGAQNPTWLDINWLVLLCMDCSGIHRSLGVQISKIRSLELDNISSDYIELLYMINQIEINKILEEKLNENQESKPKFNSSREEKEKFIINKYKEKKYINLVQINDENDVIKNIFDNIKENNLINIFRFMKLSKININSIYLFEGEEWGFLHFCAKFGKIFQIKLLYILGADITLKDKKGLKPIDYVNSDEQQQIFEYLKDKEK